MEINKNKSGDIKEISQENNELGNKRPYLRFFAESFEPEKDPLEDVLKGLKYIEDVLRKTGNAKLDQSDPSIREAQQVVKNCINQIEKIAQPTHSPPTPPSP